MGGVEVNFDGLVGPTHNYSGLSEGNVASKRNEGRLARPRAAALQGLGKMRLMMEMGLPQGVLPPHERPYTPYLRTLGFGGSDRAVWEAAWRAEPAIARSAIAASPMWTANAATVSPSADCADGRLHASTANLSTMAHRALEADVTERVLRRLLPDEGRFMVHPALPAHPNFSDEGAANHMRLAASAAAPGVEVFVYGRVASEPWRGPFPARQTLEACHAIARRHALSPARTLFIRQSAEAIAAGAFHNDVVAVSGRDCLFHHEQAFEPGALESALDAAAAACGFSPRIVTAPAALVSLEDAISSYVFNAQLVDAPGANGLTLIAPQDAAENASVKAYLNGLVASDAPIGAVRFLDLRESMRNGGGPACLRLRIEMTERERAAAAKGFFLTPALADELEAWVRRWHRESLDPSELGDPALVDEGQAALDALTRILPLGGDFYDFQRA
jgi:succinylarginine dihydrolase